MGSKSGFERVRALKVAGVAGIAGLFGGSALRAADTSLGLTVTRGNAIWTDIDNNSQFPSSSSVTTTNGAFYSQSTTFFGISDASLVASNSRGTSTTFSDAFDNALQLAVDGNRFINPDGTIDLTGDTVTSDVVVDIVPGINAQIEYHFFSDRPVVRGMFSLTNTSGGSLTIDPVVLSDYGSDTSTEVVTTSDGDNTIENSDLWYITAEGFGDRHIDESRPDKSSARGAGDPNITTTRYGTGASIVPLNALTPDDSAPAIAVSGLRYPMTLNPGQTRRILVFMEMSNPFQPTRGIGGASDFESITALENAGLLAGLSPTELSQLANYAAAAAPGPALPVPSLTTPGIIILLGLIGGIGFTQYRRKQQQS